MKWKIILAIVAAVGIGLPAAAATIPVTTTDPAEAADGQCSLIEAIVNANADAATHADCPAGGGADTIELASSTVYELDTVNVTFFGPNGLPTIGSVITIQGNGSTIRRGLAAPDLRILSVGASGTLRLFDLTVRSGNPGTGNLGGAIYSHIGVVELVRTQITDNTAQAGGGLYNWSGVMTLTDSEVSLNVAQDGGGGIFSNAQVGDATLVLERTAVTGNASVSYGGGGIFTDYSGSWRPDLQVTSSMISGNTAFWMGGGILAWRGDTTIEDSTLSGNHADSGGGLTVFHGTATIAGCTISGNTAETAGDIGGAGGGIGVSMAVINISNSTISGNEARGAATTAFYSGRGGGIGLIGMEHDPPENSLAIIENSTICDNGAEVLGGGIAALRVSGTADVEVELRNTIVAENLEAGGAVPGNCVEASPAVITSADFNLADDVTCGLMAVNDLVVADVMLSPLADNGGPTWTHRPLSGSPAVDSGDDAQCPELDQRGNIRPWDGDDDSQAHCDRGAVELKAAFFVDGFESGDTSAWSNTVN